MCPSVHGRRLVPASTTRKEIPRTRRRCHWVLLGTQLEASRCPWVPLGTQLEVSRCSWVPLGTQLEASRCSWVPLGTQLEASRCICAPARSSTRPSREGISEERTMGRQRREQRTAIDEEGPSREGISGERTMERPRRDQSTAIEEERPSREGISGERYDGKAAKGSEHGHRWKGRAKVSSMARSAISGKKVDLSVLSHPRDGSEGRPLPFSCTSTISCTLRESKLLPPFTRGQPSAGRRSIYQCRALDGTVAKVGHCRSRAQAPLVVP